MNENAGDNNSVFGRAAGTAMGVGVGAAGVGGGIWMASKGLGPAVSKGKDILKKGGQGLKEWGHDASQVAKEIKTRPQRKAVAKEVVEGLHPKPSTGPKAPAVGPTLQNAEKLANRRVGPTLQNAGKEILDSAPKGVTNGFDDILKMIGRVK